MWGSVTETEITNYVLTAYMAPISEKNYFHSSLESADRLVLESCTFTYQLTHRVGVPVSDACLFLTSLDIYIFETQCGSNVGVPRINQQDK